MSFGERIQLLPVSTIARLGTHTWPVTVRAGACRRDRRLQAAPDRPAPLSNLPAVASSSLPQARIVSGARVIGEQELGCCAARRDRRPVSPLRPTGRAASVPAVDAGRPVPVRRPRPGATVQGRRTGPNAPRKELSSFVSHATVPRDRTSHRIGEQLAAMNVACPYTCASAITLDRLRWRGRTVCNPMGRPSRLKPHGTVRRRAASVCPCRLGWSGESSQRPGRSPAVGMATVRWAGRSSIARNRARSFSAPSPAAADSAAARLYYRLVSVQSGSATIHPGRYRQCPKLAHSKRRRIFRGC